MRGGEELEKGFGLACDGEGICPGCLRWHPEEGESGLGAARFRAVRALVGGRGGLAGSRPVGVSPEGSPCEGEVGIWGTCREEVGLALNNKPEKKKKRMIWLK